MRRADFDVGVGVQFRRSSGTYEKFRRKISMPLTARCFDDSIKSTAGMIRRLPATRAGVTFNKDECAKIE